MIHALLASALLLGGQEVAQQTGIVTGTVVAPFSQQIAAPVQVVLLPTRYMELWHSEVQKRLDLYWQQYQVTFRTRKEFFLEFSKQAHKDATNYVLTRMGRDSSGKLSQYLIETSTGGRFEFNHVPFGEYKILALGKVGGQDVIWQEFVDVRSEIPYFVELKTHLP
jgi:hypothetical protein